MTKFAILYTDEYGEICLRFDNCGNLIEVVEEDRNMLKECGIDDIEEFLNRHNAPTLWEEYTIHWNE